MSGEIDNLLDQAARRVRRVTRMLPATGQLGSNDRQAAIEDIVGYCRENGVSQSQLAHSSGCSNKGL